MGLKNAGGGSPESSGSRSVGKQLESWRSRDAMGGIRVNSDIRTNDAPVPFSATGGTEITTPPGAKYHIFTGPGTFEVTNGGPNNAENCEIVIVAGGGGGGGKFYSGGGGAGGVVHGPAIPLGTGSYTITVGGGGLPSPIGPFDNTGADYQGKPSTFVESPTVTVTAIGGGSGGMQGTPTSGGGHAGGSSGGSSQYGATVNTTATPQPVPGDYTAYGNMAYGNQGGHPDGPQTFQGGGGGGAGGINRPSNYPPSPENQYYGGQGGIGQPFTNFPAPVIVPNISFPGNAGHTLDRTLTGMGTDGYVGGGGGGASYYNTGPGYFSNVNVSGQPQWAGNAKVGKDGGGGAGGGSRDTVGANGWPAAYMLGGGGGGANYNTPEPHSINPFNSAVGTGGSGGPGCVMIRYVV